MDTQPAPAQDEIILPPAPPADNPFWEHSSHTGRKPATTSVKSSITHDAVIDQLLANPRATNKELAATFGYSVASISIIINSDAFQARYHKRREGIVDPILAATIEDRMKGLTSQSMEILARKLETSDDASFALKVFDSTSRAAGYGVAKPVAIQQNFVVAVPGPAASSSEWVRRFAPASADIVEPRFDEAPSEAGGTAETVSNPAKD